MNKKFVYQVGNNKRKLYYDARQSKYQQHKMFVVTTQKIIVFYIGILSACIIYMPDDGF
jgi:hypothetical protein